MLILILYYILIENVKDLFIKDNKELMFKSNIKYVIKD